MKNGGTVEKQYRYDYDLAGNRTVEQVDSVVKTAGYGDAAQGSGQMVFEGQTNEPATVTVGGQVAAVDALNRFRAVAAVTAGVTNSIEIKATDADGTTTKHAQVTVPAANDETYTYDFNGNLTGLSTLNSQLPTSYEWDAANRLVAIVFPAGANAGRTEFSYNGRGQRVREVEKNGSGTVTADRRLVWEGWALREQRNASHQVTRRYFQHGVQEVTNSGNTQYTQNYYYVRDHLGSIREMVDSSGSTQARYSYDPWGRRTKVTGSKDADFGFTGHYYHARSGLHLAFYRAYSAEMGRWLSRDPIGERGGLNLYGYVGNDPLRRLDPFGLAWWDPIYTLPVIGTIINALVTPSGTSTGDYDTSLHPEDGEIACERAKQRISLQGANYLGNYWMYNGLHEGIDAVVVIGAPHPWIKAGAGLDFLADLLISLYRTGQIMNGAENAKMELPCQ